MDEDEEDDLVEDPDEDDFEEDVVVREGVLLAGEDEDDLPEGALILRTEPWLLLPVDPDTRRSVDAGAEILDLFPKLPLFPPG